MAQIIFNNTGFEPVAEIYDGPLPQDYTSCVARAEEVEAILNSNKPIFEVAVFVKDPKQENGEAQLIYKTKRT